jgi:N-acetylglucosamine kinase-like BadF-type ATPase
MRAPDARAVGVDIGGTKTHLAAVDAGRALNEQVLPTESWRVRRPEEDAVTLAGLARQTLGGAEPEVLVVGAHGCDSAQSCAAFQHLLAGQTTASVLVLNDSELLLPAMGLAEGIAMIAGTGSIAVARGADAAMLTAGGWGWFLGDEGSASGLVREAARAVRAALDRGEPPDALAQALLEALGIDDPILFGRALLREGSAARIGRHAPLVFAAAERGSALAATVIAEAGAALALLVGRLVRRGATGRHVVVGGGVITAQPRLLSAFETALQAAAPGWTSVVLQAPPVAGAVALARRLLRGETVANLPAPSRRDGGT